MNSELTPIYLTEEEAKRFVAFHKRYAFINLLESLNVFDIRNGHITVHFDEIGQIRKVETHNNYNVSVKTGAV